MDQQGRCRIADLVATDLAARRLRGRTWPYRWVSSVFGPLFDRSVPTRRMWRRESRAMGLALALLLPVMLVALVIASPIEWLRSRRLGLHNAAALRRLTAAGQEVGTSPHRHAEQRVALDFRIEHQGQAVFFGVALVVLTVGGPQLLGCCVHRSIPAEESLDAEGLCRTMTLQGAQAPTVAHWQWSLHDPYDLVERPTRPW